MGKPIVAIVGRPNVGKSTLFNIFANSRISIVEDTPGVTRDRLYATAEWLDHEFMMVDTGGIEIMNADAIAVSIRQQAQIAIREADVILFVCDARTGISTEDADVARILRQSKKPIVLAINKADSPKQEMNVYEFYNLGIGEPIPVSAANHLGLGDLLDAIVAKFGDKNTFGEPEDEDEIKVALIGRPNVGKSSIFNALVGEERSIVSNVAGTTRDAIDTPVVRNGQRYLFIDTAGMRRKSKIDEPIEKYSIMRSLRAVDRCDVVLMVFDAVEGVTEQDKKIVGYAHEAGKGVILVVNKWDLYDSHYTERYMETPQLNAEGYVTSSVLPYVDGYPTEYNAENCSAVEPVMLKLTHGTTDDNVHFQNMLMLVDELHKCGKKFEFMIYPDGMHGYRGYQGQHFQEANNAFWKKYLLEK